MALDSSGNQAIDFVWGSSPLKPDTDRAENTADLTTTLTGIGNAGQPNGLGFNQAVLTVAGWSSADLSDGDVITITGTNTEADGDYTVIGDVYPQSPSGLAFNTSTPYSVTLGYTPGPAVPVGALVTKSVAGNFGGGKGDKGWTKTTKKVSGKLDPALDGHNIATEYWNNFPDYTPNAGFIPQELWSHSFGTNSGITIGPDWREAYFNSYPSGYVVNLSLAVLQNTAKYDEIISYINSDAVIGKSTDAFTISTTDSYNQPFTVNLPAGHIVGSDVGSDMYGATTATLTVYTGNIVTSSPSQWGVARPVSNAFDFVIGAGVNKALIYKGVAGVDFSQTYETTDNMYGETSTYLRLMQLSAGNPLSAATLALEPMDLTGAVAGYGNIQPTDMFGYDIGRVTFPILDADFTYNTDMYGAQLTNVRLIGAESGISAGGNLYEASYGTVLYIIK